MKPKEKSLSQIASEGTIWVSITNLVTKVTSFLSVFIILNKLTVYEYGVFQLVLSIFTVGGLFILSNLTDVVITDVSFYKENETSRAKGILKGFFKAQVILSFVCWFVLFFFASLISSKIFGEPISDMIRIISLYFLVSPIRTLFNIYFTVLLKFSRTAIMAVLEEVFRLVFIFVFLYILENGVEGLLIAQVVAQVLTIMIMFPLFKKDFILLGDKEERGSVFDILLNHGKWALFVSYVSNLNKSIRVWLIKAFIGTEAVGLFSVASSLFGHIKSLLPFQNIITPIIPLYINDKEKMSRILSKSFKYLLLLFLGLGVISFIIFPPIIVFLFPHYEGSMDIYRVMLLGLFSTGFAIILTPVFYSLKKLFPSYLDSFLPWIPACRAYCRSISSMMQIPAYSASEKYFICHLI